MLQSNFEENVCVVDRKYCIKGSCDRSSSTEYILVIMYSGKTLIFSAVHPDEMKEAIGCLYNVVFFLLNSKNILTFAGIFQMRFEIWLLML